MGKCLSQDSWYLKLVEEAGRIGSMGDMQKITVTVPVSLLRNATNATGKGVSETVREALKDLAHREACRRIRAMRGKLELDIDLKTLRED